MTAPDGKSAAAERARAARLLYGVVVDGRTTDQVLSGAAASPLTQELVLGTLRHYFSLRRTVDDGLHRPMKAKDRDLWLLMLVGVYQLRFTRVPDHAALFETVEACVALGKPWARNLVNAVLRRAAAAPDGAEPSSEHPPWLEQALRRCYPDAEALMAANNQRAPMTLRINLTRTRVADYVSTLDRAGLASRAAAGDVGPRGLGPETRVLAEPCATAALPGHDQGLVSVQDAGAQFTPGLLSPRPGERVLDACAAPGGKLFHLLERCPGIRVAAVERSAPRLEGLRREARRLGHQGFLGIEADATTLDWWDGLPFQRVLIDAPCSGTGTLRRHPDIKVLRQPRDLSPLVDLQRRLLTVLWRVLEPGGTLVYCTCSILPAENDEVIGSFLAQQSDAVPSPFQLTTGRATDHGWQLLPTDPDTDGFYYARMTKAGS